MLHHNPDKDSIWADHGEIDSEWGQWSESWAEWGPAGPEDKSNWCAKKDDPDETAWPKLTQGDTVGLLWDADAGNLTVFVNGERQGFANGKRWMGEIKGDLCWKASISCYTEDRDEDHPDENPPRVSLMVERRPPPVMTQTEARAERLDLSQMEKLHKERTEEVAKLKDLRANPRCPGCKRRYKDIPNLYVGSCCPCCQDCCY